MSKPPSSDSASLCSFRYANRRCRMPRSSPNAKYCTYHQRRMLAQGRDTAYVLFEPIAEAFVPVSGLTQSLARLFACVADGRIKAKDAVAMTRVAETLLKTLPLSNQEFNDVYIAEYRRQLIEHSFNNIPDYEPEGQQKPAPKDGCPPASTPSPTSNPDSNFAETEPQTTDK